MKIRLLWIVGGCFIAAAITLYALSRNPLPPQPGVADRIVVQKQAHSMSLYRGDTLLAEYAIALGRGGIGPKIRAGDNRVPEGDYIIAGRNAHSAFHKALRIGYPTVQQIAYAKRVGVDPGGDIMIHGIRNGLGWLGPLQRKVDWTKGCVAVTDAEIDQIWEAVPVGTRIEINP